MSERMKIRLSALMKMRKMMTMMTASHQIKPRIGSRIGFKRFALTSQLSFDVFQRSFLARLI